MNKPGNETGALKVTMGLVFAGLVLFGASFSHPFHFDDALITNDSNVVNPAQWLHFLNPFHLRQLTYFSFYLNHLIAGSRPFGYHVVNVGLHLANAVLLFLLLKGFLERRTAIIAAAIFLAHPIQTEPVLYVYQRSILLACFFSLLALLAYQRDRKSLALILFICAFESKEAALAVPLLLLIKGLCERPPAASRLSPFSRGTNIIISPPCKGGVPPKAARGSLTHPRFYFAVLGSVVLALGAGALALLAYRHELTVGFGVVSQVSPFAYFLTETRVIYTYLRLLVFPYPQSLEYDFALIHSLTFQVIAQIVGLVSLIGVAIAMVRSEKWRITGLSILAFFVLLLPTSSIIPSADVAFEHRLYLPMLAFAVFAASLIVRLKRPEWIAVPLLAVLSILTIQRGAVWASDAALWKDTTLHVPNKPRAWFNLGGATLVSDPDTAKMAFNRVLALQPQYPEAAYDLGVIEQRKGNYREAYAKFELAVDQEPDDWSAWNNLGNVLFALGEGDHALDCFQRSLSLNPDYWPAQYNIAIVHFVSGRFDKALPRLRTVLDWRPDFRDARYLLVECLSRTGDSAEAERERQKLGQTAGQPPLPATIPAPTP